MSTYTKEQIRNMVDGKLDWDTTLRMLSMPKDGERFSMYVDALQHKLGWKDRIVLPLGPHLYIVQQRATKQWVTQCDCGHVFCDYRENWKLHANIFVRDAEEAMDEVYPRLMAPDTQWQVYREYYCPTCGAMHDVEAPTPWYPVVHDFEPDIDAFYSEWVGLPVPARAD
ncbi:MULTISPECIES: acetone carboxylase subunit gamma [Burkholderia]|uniref:Acetone carboxylase subunit gamma n=1 Tax=Burkholderia mayonis TaxID=1385591 RepID=A0A1B4FK65_9BURK|nr:MULTISPECIES: acetone carboxylase subunit gamma [Burkholderia]AOJ04069.1 acetone carboxylase subunit gamma [Burkholderia mayonis]KVE45569.1 acetone carboxylase subunit gamma [Burkholderia sp. BDU5]KVE46088.1 acetone carboxylase subunit gamma [Burkholderia mayonis]